MCIDRKSSLGISLPELILFIVVVGVGLAGILTALTMTASRSADPLPGKQALAVAESLIGEISAKSYANPAGGYSGPLRQSFDDVSDYAGYSTVGGIVAADGITALPGLSAYNITGVAVSVTTLGTTPAI